MPPLLESKMPPEELLDDSTAFGVSEDLIPLSPVKAAGTSQVSFSGLLNPPLIIQEDLKEGCGGQLWPAGVCLARFLLQKKHEWRGKTMYAYTTVHLA